MLDIQVYQPELQSEWDAFVAAAKNGTFLFRRDYMSHHSDRFNDLSLIVRDRGRTVALLPAHLDNGTLYSHRGLTYGGFIVDRTMSTLLMLDVLQATREALSRRSITRLVYKAVPHIYHVLPAEEDRYALFDNGARLCAREVLSVVAASPRPSWQTRRRRGASRAESAGLTVTASDDWPGFWTIPVDNLQRRHGAGPVHTVEEIVALAQLFPDNIKLFVCRDDAGIQGGTVIYESANVARAQYIASTPRGRDVSALDLLFKHLLDVVYGEKPFFDFGSSMSAGENGLNRGLIEQKERFGARTVVQDTYELSLA